MQVKQIIHLSIVRRTPRPPGMVRHLSYVSRIFIYHDAPVCLDYDGPFLTMHTCQLLRIKNQYVKYDGAKRRRPRARIARAGEGVG